MDTGNHRDRLRDGKGQRVERLHTTTGKDVPNGTNYEATEGARGGRAVRQKNCQPRGSSGGGSADTGAAARAWAWGESSSAASGTDRSGGSGAEA